MTLDQLLSNKYVRASGKFLKGLLYCSLGGFTFYAGVAKRLLLGAYSVTKAFGGLAFAYGCYKFYNGYEVLKDGE